MKLLIRSFLEPAVAFTALDPNILLSTLLSSTVSDSVTFHYGTNSWHHQIFQVWGAAWNYFRVYFVPCTGKAYGRKIVCVQSGWLWYGAFGSHFMQKTRSSKCPLMKRSCLYHSSIMMFPQICFISTLLYILFYDYLLTKSHIHASDTNVTWIMQKKKYWILKSLREMYEGYTIYCLSYHSVA
jgi:hypothetical protein